MIYNWQLADWPNFRYDPLPAEEALYAFAREAGQSTGLLKALPAESQTEAAISIMLSEAIKTSEIEGEFLSRTDVMSSIRNKLGLNSIPVPVKDKKSAGAGALMVAVRSKYAAPLTASMLFSWHSILMAGSPGITIGAWRSHEDPMQIVSGAYGKWKVHFEAPPSSRVSKEMKRFIQWFNATAPGGKDEIKKAPIRSAIAHLHFETIHPFEDGNGRIGRALAEKALSQTLGMPVMLSLSQAIEANKKAYYKALMQAQRSNDISSWIAWFAALALDAQRRSGALIDFTLRKARFFDRYKQALNARQLKALHKMAEAGPEGFEGGMTAAKYTSITKAPKATATRDLQALTLLGALLPEGGGRSVRYRLNLDAQ